MNDSIDEASRGLSNNNQNNPVGRGRNEAINSYFSGIDGLTDGT